MKNNSWFKDYPKCVVFCAGKGTRLLPVTLKKQKTMIEINEKPILGYIIDYWKQFTNDFLFVIKYKKEGISDYLKTRQDISYDLHEESVIKGISDGLIEIENKINGNFIVVLGDCFCRGEFIFPPEFEQGVGVWQAKQDDDIKRSYSVQKSGQDIIKVIEKPKNIINRNCGMGFYFFNTKVFKYIKKIPPDRAGNRGITEVIQAMIDDRETVKCIDFIGDYLNVTFSEDLKRLKKIID